LFGPRECLVQIAALPLRVGRQLHSATRDFELLGVQSSDWPDSVSDTFTREFALHILAYALLSRRSIEPTRRLNIDLFSAKTGETLH